MSRSPPLPIATVPGGDNTQDEAGCITIRCRLPLERMFTNKEARLARQLRRFCRNARGRSSIELCATIESGIRGLGSPPHELRPVVADARALFSSFRRRRTHAQHRAQATAEGPKRTAESYILEAILLDQDARQSGNPQGTGE